MNPERREYLNLNSKPGRITSEEASYHLGCNVHEITILTSAGLLPPLGNPSENGCKYFSSVELDRLNRDIAWQARACDTIVKYWKAKNLERRANKTKTKWQPPRLEPSRSGPPAKPLAMRTRPPQKS